MQTRDVEAPCPTILPYTGANRSLTGKLARTDGPSLAKQDAKREAFGLFREGKGERAMEALAREGIKAGEVRERATFVALDLINDGRLGFAMDMLEMLEFERGELSLLFKKPVLALLGDYVLERRQYGTAASGSIVSPYDLMGRERRAQLDDAQRKDAEVDTDALVVDAAGFFGVTAAELLRPLERRKERIRETADADEEAAERREVGMLRMLARRAAEPGGR